MPRPWRPQDSAWRSIWAWPNLILYKKGGGALWHPASGPGLSIAFPVRKRIPDTGCFPCFWWRLPWPPLSCFPPSALKPCGIFQFREPKLWSPASRKIFPSDVEQILGKKNTIRLMQSYAQALAGATIEFDELPDYDTAIFFTIAGAIPPQVEVTSFHFQGRDIIMDCTSPDERSAEELFLAFRRKRLFQPRLLHHPHGSRRWICLSVLPDRLISDHLFNRTYEGSCFSAKPKIPIDRIVSKCYYLYMLNIYR